MACHRRHRRRAAWSSGHLRCVRYAREQPPFTQTRCGAVRFEGARVDHDGFGGRALGGQRREYSIEHAQPAPARKTVVQGLVRTVGGRGASAHQPASGDMDDAADDPAVIDPRHASRLVGQKWLQARKLSFCGLEVLIRHGESPDVWDVESQLEVDGNPPLRVLTLSQRLEGPRPYRSPSGLATTANGPVHRRAGKPRTRPASTQRCSRRRQRN